MIALALLYIETKTGSQYLCARQCLHSVSGSAMTYIAYGPFLPQFQPRLVFSNRHHAACGMRRLDNGHAMY